MSYVPYTGDSQFALQIAPVIKGEDAQGRESLVTGGTGTAYTLTPLQPIEEYKFGVAFFVEFGSPSANSPTLAISGLANPPHLVKQLEDGSYTDIQAGEIPAGHASQVTLISESQALIENMPPQSVDLSDIENRLDDVETLAEINQLNIGNKADQNDLDAINQAVTELTVAIALTANQIDLDALAAELETKATPADVTAAIAALVNGAPDALNTLNELATALAGEAATINDILSELGNRVRVDAAQSFTTPQKAQARSNINAEAVGVAAALVAAITAASIGAATAAQGAKADSALQSGDVAPAALSGSFLDLINKSSLFNLVYSAYVIGSNTAIVATDTLGQMLGKLQAQINTLAPTTFNQSRWQSEDFLFDAGKFTFTQPTSGLASCLDNPNLLTSGCARLVADGFTGSGGFAKVESEVAILRKAGLLIRSIFVLDNTAFTHRTIGLSNVVSGTTSPTVGIFLRCASAATNSYSVVAVNGGSATTVGTTTLPVNTILFMDMEWLTLTSVRVVVFDATTKYIDQTITTNLPTSAQKFCASIYHVNSSTPILYLDYVGWGHTRPPEIVTPT